MSSYDGKNFFEVLGAFCPGYKGYKEKEQRRDCDRILRDAIVKRILEKKPVVEQIMSEMTRQSRFDLMQKFDSICRKMVTVADSVKSAPRGYSAFFDTVQVNNEDLDRLYRYDLGLKEKTEAFSKVMATLPGAEPGSVAGGITQALQDLQEAVQHRTDALTEVS